MTSISACMVVWNNENEIERCLRSLEGAVDEIVLVHDGPCSDRTLEIAQGFGARICVVPERVGEAEPHRPLSFALATGDWILRIDADEFLSDELRSALPELAARDDVDGWSFVWPIWNPQKGRYVTRGAPYKLALTRRTATMRLGLPHSHTSVRGPTVQTDLVLEHRPLQWNYGVRTLLANWRRWAPMHARVYLMNWRDIPQFGYPAGADWPPLRTWGNRLSPLLIVPYGLVEFLSEMWEFRRLRPVRWLLRTAATGSLYVMFVQAHVAEIRYLDWSAGRPPAGIEPARYSADETPSVP